MSKIDIFLMLLCSSLILTPRCFCSSDSNSRSGRQKRDLMKLMMTMYYDPVRLIRYYYATDVTKEIVKSWRKIIPTVLLLPITENLPDTHGIGQFISPVVGYKASRPAMRKAFKYPFLQIPTDFPKDPLPRIHPNRPTLPKYQAKEQNQQLNPALHHNSLIVGHKGMNGSPLSDISELPTVESISPPMTFLREENITFPPFSAITHFQTADSTNPTASVAGAEVFKVALDKYALNSFRSQPVNTAAVKEHYALSHVDVNHPIDIFAANSFFPPKNFRFGIRPPFPGIIIEPPRNGKKRTSSGSEENSHNWEPNHESVSKIAYSDYERTVVVETPSRHKENFQHKLSEMKLNSDEEFDRSDDGYLHPMFQSKSSDDAIKSKLQGTEVDGEDINKHLSLLIHPVQLPSQFTEKRNENKSAQEIMLVLLHKKFT